jgi:hypothetical protein
MRKFREFIILADLQNIWASKYEPDLMGLDLFKKRLISGAGS